VVSRDVERIRVALEAIPSGQLEPLLGVADPDIEWRPLLVNVEGSEYRGHEGIRQWFRDFTEIFDDVGAEVSEIEALDDCVIATGTIHARARVSGAPVDQPATWLATMRDGKAIRLEVFSDRASAERAARGR
jgi:ketosteroid isomerase-like protein